jgi:DNA mismatch endonuclease (patch repair protein)
VAEARNIYIRDGRAPIPLKESTSEAMRANRAKDTRPELALRKALRKEGIKGYRLNWGKAPGRPDIAFPGKKLAIFVHGCFWHRCPHCQPILPKSHGDFWEHKFKENMRRDEINVLDLKQAGWNVLTLWECELEGKMNLLVIDIKELLSRGKND